MACNESNRGCTSHSTVCNAYGINETLLNITLPLFNPSVLKDECTHWHMNLLHYNKGGSQVFLIALTSTMFAQKERDARIKKTGKDWKTNIRGNTLKRQMLMQILSAGTTFSSNIKELMCLCHTLSSFASISTTSVSTSSMPALEKAQDQTVYQLSLISDTSAKTKANKRVCASNT